MLNGGWIMGSNLNWKKEDMSKKLQSGEKVKFLKLLKEERFNKNEQKKGWTTAVKLLDKYVSTATGVSGCYPTICMAVVGNKGDKMKVKIKIDGFGD